METERLSRQQLNEMDHEELVEAYMAFQSRVRDQEEKIDLLTQELNHMKAMMFGRKSEKKPDNTTDDQIRFEFNEIESIPAEEDTEEVTVKGHTRKVKRAGKKKEDLSKLPKQVITHSIPEDKLKEEFPDGWNRLPDEVYTNVVYIPAQYIAMEHHIEVYCGKKEDRILRAEHPKELFDGSIATPSLLAGIMNGKYVNATPLYRMEQEFMRNDVPISRQNMAGWVNKAAERYLSLIYDRLKAEMLSHRVVHADETPLLVTKDGRPAGSRSYMWVYRSNILDKDNELEQLTSQERLEARKKDIKPLVDAFFAWVKEHRDDVTRKSNTGKAFTYTIEQEQYLRTFLRDGDVPMDNNAAERAIRPFCIGKKNWVMCDTIHGAENSAIVYSLTETAKANDLRPYEYLKYLLTEILQHMDDTDLTFLDELLPWSDALPDACRKQNS